MNLGGTPNARLIHERIHSLLEDLAVDMVAGCMGLGVADMERGHPDMDCLAVAEVVVVAAVHIALGVVQASHSRPARATGSHAAVQGTRRQAAAGRELAAGPDPQLQV